MARSKRSLASDHFFSRAARSLCMRAQASEGPDSCASASFCLSASCSASISRKAASAFAYSPCGKWRLSRSSRTRFSSAAIDRSNRAIRSASVGASGLPASGVPSAGLSDGAGDVPDTNRTSPGCSGLCSAGGTGAPALGAAGGAGPFSSAQSWPEMIKLSRTVDSAIAPTKRATSASLPNVASDGFPEPRRSIDNPTCGARLVCPRAAAVFKPASGSLLAYPQ